MKESVKDAAVIRIECLCAERGLVPNELANRCGLTPSTVYSLLSRRRRDVSLLTIKKICDGLEITLHDFFDDAAFEMLEAEIS